MEELTSELGELFRGARRVGNARGKRSGRVLGVFRTRRGGRAYHILARPLRDNQHAVMAIASQPVDAAPDTSSPGAYGEPIVPMNDAPTGGEPASDGGAGDDGAEGEYVAKRFWFTGPNLALPTEGKPAVHIHWWGPCKLDDVALKRITRPVVYIIEDATTGNVGRPIYVGTAENVFKRMNEHLNAFAAKKAPFDKARLDKLASTPKELRVRVGLVNLPPIRVLETLEHAIVRTLQPDPKKRQVLLNKKPVAPFQVMNRIVVNGIVPDAPGYPKTKGIDLRAGSMYELEDR